LELRLRGVLERVERSMGIGCIRMGRIDRIEIEIGKIGYIVVLVIL
jgi:hypothetical protein